MFCSMTSNYWVFHRGRCVWMSKFWIGTLEDLMAYISGKIVLFLEALKPHGMINRYTNKIFKVCGRETNYTGKNFHK